MILKIIYHYYLIKKSRLFKREYYLNSYPDVKNSGIDPLLHFIKYGWKEGKNPSPSFNIKKYQFINPDVVNLNPLIHYIKHGKQEGRQLDFPESDEKESRHIDLSSKNTREDLPEFHHRPPLTKIDFVIFPIIDWYYRFQRPQHIANQLADLGHRIFYITTDFRHDHYPSVYKIKKNIFLVRLTTKDPDLIFNTLLTHQNALDLLESIEIIKDHFVIESAVIKVDSPFWANLTVLLKNNFGWKLVYDCMDLHTGFSISSTNAGKDEAEILEESDLVLASSTRLFDHVKEKNENSILLPNATNFEHFNQNQKNIKNDRLNDLGSPIIGYYGAIADWFDSELIGKLANQHQEWTFVLIGDTYLANLKPIINLDNIHLFGEIPYSEIPGYLWSFDVCIIPFKKIPLTEATNPVKLFEYLSAGKPVVSTKLEEISRYSAYVKLVDTVGEWESAIIDCLNEEKIPDLLEKRFAFARANTWEKRVKELMPHIYALFSNNTQ